MLIDICNNTACQSLGSSCTVDGMLFPEALCWECRHLYWYVGLQCQKGDIEALCASLGGVDLVVALDCSDKSLRKINPFSATTSILESTLFLPLP